MHFKIVLVTAPAEETAKELAARAVEAGLAACVTVVPGITSVYYWNESIQTDTETQLLFKTSEEKILQLKEYILDSHPYECPEFLVLDISTAEERYSAWMKNTLSRTLNHEK
jgi:periplasmic divalent cation tolerance protein